jgi:putative FmdB family regulatory protein
MPTYEYECKKCGHRFEEFQRITDPPVRRCPRCKGRVRRLLGAGAGIIFKGSGFYETDYRSRSYREQARKEKEQQAGDSGKKPEEKGKRETGKESGESQKKQDA